MRSTLVLMNHKDHYKIVDLKAKEYFLDILDTIFSNFIVFKQTFGQMPTKYFFGLFIKPLR